MRRKTTGACKSPRNIRTWSRVFGRLSRLLARPKSAQTNEYDDIRYVLPFFLP
jgi:hypothetical protein